MVVVSLVLGIGIRLYGNRNSSKYVVVMADGKLYQKIPLLKDLKKSIIMVKSNEGYLYLEIEQDRVRVIDSTCPDKLCIKQGWISNIGETIVCLPNRITISIVGGNVSVDSISY
nr:NusG domain II-containing protein [Caldisericum exile]